MLSRTSRWPKNGEWDHESDSFVDVYRNHFFGVFRNPVSGSLNGYCLLDVRKKKGVRGLSDKDRAAIECHGGLTYESEKAPGMAKLYGVGSEGGFWVGFDTNHGGDASPSWKFGERDTYKNMQFCKDQCRSIIDQVIARTLANSLRNREKSARRRERKAVKSKS
jgi:hypothetical protein